MEIKQVKLYVCPVCKKEYKRKGKYLSAHLKKCGAIAWYPKIRYEISMREIDSDRFAEAIENLYSGNFIQKVDPIERIKNSHKKALKTIEPERINSFRDVMNELKEKFQSNEPILVSCMQ